MVDILHVAKAGEGHLLLDVVAEPLAANGIAEDGRGDGAEEQAAVEHGLKGEAAADGERHAPVGTHLAHARRLTQFAAVVGPYVELSQVVGHVSILSLEAGTAGGEVPVVLAVVVDSAPVAEEVLVFERHLLCLF